MNCDTREISGVWTGKLQRDDDESTDISFSAWLNERDGRLSGSTLEPNTFVEGQGDELDAVLRGHIDQQDVVFIKSYNGVDQEPVYFEGEIVDQGRRIIGKWYFGWPDEIVGSFEMSRDGQASGRAASTAERGQI